MIVGSGTLQHYNRKSSEPARRGGTGASRRSGASQADKKIYPQISQITQIKSEAIRKSRQTPDYFLATLRVANPFSLTLTASLPSLSMTTHAP